MPLFYVRLVYGAVILAVAYYVGRGSLGLWLFWMAALFVFWYVGESFRNNRRQKEGEEFLERWNNRQLKPNKAEVAEIGDIVSYRFKEGIHPIQKLTIVASAEGSLGHVLLGYRKGDCVTVPIASEGYKEAVIVDIEKGWSAGHKSVPDS